MLNMLPIYADHILYPTLNDSSFTTEIHHVTKEGEDKGVVYCEMQGRENNDSSLVDRAVLDLLYPTGGYSAETGGKMANLRELTNAQVTRYHVENYRPDNMAFIVSVCCVSRRAQTLHTRWMLSLLSPICYHAHAFARHAPWDRAWWARPSS